MANALKFDFTTDTPAATFEASVNSGTSYALLTTTGTTNKTGTLTGVTARAFTAGEIKLRPVGFPAAAVSNTAEEIVSRTNTATVLLFVGQSNDSGLSPRTGLAAAYFNTDPRIRSWDKTTGRAGSYALGSIDAGGNPTGANDHAITKAIVPSYDNGIGPDVGFVKAWKDDAANANKELFIFKIDLTPPASTNGKSIKAWTDGTDGVTALYPDFLSQWNAFKSYLLARGFTTFVTTIVCGIGEQDSVNYLSGTTGGTNPNFAGSLTAFIGKFVTDGVLTSSSPVLIAQKQRSQDGTIAAAQASYVSANSAIAKLVQLTTPAFLADNTHYTQDSILRLGALEYALYSGAQGSGTILTTFDATQGWTYDANWLLYTSAAGQDSFSGSLYYTTTDNAVATRTLVVSQPSILKFFQNRATGYGTGVVKLNGVALGAPWTANGPNSGPDGTNPVFISPVIQPGTYTLTVTNTVLDIQRAQIILDRSTLTAA